MRLRLSLSALALASCSAPATTAPTSSPTCALEPAVALASDADAVPRSLARVDGALHAQLLRDTPSGARVSLVRVHDGAVEGVLEREAPSQSAVSGLREQGREAVFARAAAGVLETLSLGPMGASTRSFPRGEPPLGREPLVPAVSLGQDSEGSVALLSWPGRYGTQRAVADSVTDSVGLTPLRRDRFARPHLAMAGENALIAQERRVGSFVAERDEPAEVELAVFANGSMSRNDPLSVRVSPPGARAWSPRVAAFAPGAVPSSSALVTWIDAQGLSAAIARPSTPEQPWTVDAPLRVLAGDAPAATALVDLPSSCGVAVATARPGAVEVRRVSAQGVVGASIARATLGTGNFELGLGRAGNRVVLAASDGASVQRWDLRADPACALSLVPVPGASPRGRLVGVAGGAERVLLASAVDEGEGARVTVEALLADGGPAEAVTDALLPRGARSLAQAVDGVALVASATDEGAQVDRLDDEKKSLVVYLSQGVDLQVVDDPIEGRVWTVETQELDPRVGYAQSTVAHSLRDDFEDGPQTEVRAGLRVPARFERFAVHPLTARDAEGALVSALATLWSGALDEPAPCIEGAWLALVERAPLARALPLAGASGDGPWPGARALVDPARRTCSDRVHAARWDARGRFALTLAGPRLGALALWGALDDPAVRERALEPVGTLVEASGLAVTDAGTLAVWTRAGELRAQWFDPEGQAVGAPRGLDERTLPDGADGWSRLREGLPVLALGGGRFAVSWPSPTGPRLRTLRCGP